MTDFRLYGIFAPDGTPRAAFEDYRAADAMARYAWDIVKERLYWSIAPQAPTIARVTFSGEPPTNPHLFSKDDSRCSCFDCPRHSPGVLAR